MMTLESDESIIKLKIRRFIAIKSLAQALLNIGTGQGRKEYFFHFVLAH